MARARDKLAGTITEILPPHVLLFHPTGTIAEPRAGPSVGQMKEFAGSSGRISNSRLKINQVAKKQNQMNSSALCNSIAQVHR